MAAPLEISIHVELPEENERILTAIVEAMSDALPESLDEAGKFVLDESNNLVPVETGALMESGKSEVSGEGLDAQVSIEYGNAQVDYAVIVHERLDVRHTVGQAKFLETAILNNLDRVQEMVSSSLAIAVTSNLE